MTEILIAEDEALYRRLLESTLAGWGYAVVSAINGREALDKLSKPQAPLVALLDVMMPHVDGIEVCRALRKQADVLPPYLILLTAKDDKQDVVRGLKAGANDYITKPFDPAELEARINIAVQVVELRQKLAARVKELEDAFSKVKLLEGMLPICSYCKAIRNDQNYWQTVEEYLMEHSSTLVSHGICPACYESIALPQLHRMPRELEELE